MEMEKYRSPLLGCSYLPQFLEKEKSHLTKALISNGYTKSQINKVFHFSCKPKSKNASSSPPLALISYPTSMAPLITFPKLSLRRISKPSSNPSKPSNSLLELLRINQTLC
jgi:hypothetical protein